MIKGDARSLDYNSNGGGLNLLRCLKIVGTGNAAVSGNQQDHLAHHHDRAF